MIGPGHRPPPSAAGMKKGRRDFFCRWGLVHFLANERDPTSQALTENMDLTPLPVA
jgi:hypothetical protein